MTQTARPSTHSPAKHPAQTRASSKTPASPVCPRCGSTRSHAKGRRRIEREGDTVVTQSRLCVACKRQFTVEFQEVSADPKVAKRSDAAMDRPNRGLPQPASALRSNVPAMRENAQIPASHRRLELDVPADSSFEGLLSFTAFAQQELQRALTAYADPIHAELEWQRLTPALRGYVQARQRLEVAFALQWNAVYAQLLRPPQVLPRATPATPVDTGLPKRPVETRPQPTKRRPVATRPSTGATAALKQVALAHSVNREPATRTTESDPSDPPAEPDRAAHLEELARLRLERLQLKQQLFSLEADNQRLTGHWSTLKEQVLRLKSGRAPDLVSSVETAVADLSGLPDTVKDTRRSSSGSRGGRIAPPLYSAAEEANIQRLASALLAHLTRLEDHRVRPRDLPHITGERGPWKSVITHLLSLGKIVWQGDLVALSLVERIRRNLR